MSDIGFSGGMWGILGGNQQYTIRGATFDGCANAIGMIWDWGWASSTCNLLAFMSLTNLDLVAAQHHKLQCRHKSCGSGFLGY
jgi:hypothetical protein